MVVECVEAMNLIIYDSAVHDLSRYSQSCFTVLYNSIRISSTISMYIYKTILYTIYICVSISICPYQYRINQKDNSEERQQTTACDIQFILCIYGCLRSVQQIDAFHCLHFLYLICYRISSHVLSS